MAQPVPSSRIDSHGNDPIWLPWTYILLVTVILDTKVLPTHLHTERDE